MSEADIATLRAGTRPPTAETGRPHSGAHPDFEWKTDDRVPGAGTYRGREQVRRFLEDQREPFEEVVLESQEFFERGDQIVVFVLVRLRPRGSSAVVESRIGHLWTMSDGKALRCESFAVRAEALQAAGLSE